MKQLIIRLLVIVSIPIIIGVALVLSTFYILLWEALDQWELESNSWINQTQQQVLYNQVFSQQILQEYSFNQLEIHMVIIKSLLQKFDSSQIKQNYDAVFSICSYREFTFNQCSQQIYKQLNQSLFYGDLYFVRSIFKFNLLTPEQKYFIQMNNYISFYARAAFMASQTNGIIQLNYIYNSDTTSVLTGVPSQSFNFTDSQYETCFGSSFVEPYDPRCRSWYQYAQQNQGNFIYQPYQDAVVGNLLMTLSSQVKKENAFYSVLSIDFLIQNLISLFNSNLSIESYPVLIHEFDARVLYHPLQVFYKTISWPDIEFFNINQFCSKNKEEMELCLSQKQKLSQQVNQTIEFIKTGNYSIEQQINLGRLYQYWERFGQKQISLIFPIQSKLRGLNNQQPYSYAIILIVKVIIDNSDKFKIFNLLDINIIRIPLIVEFVSVSAIIIIFLINYGYFLVYQIQQPIQILIMFLKRSHMQQISSQQQSSIATIKQQKLKNQFSSQLNSTKKKPNQSIFSNIIQKKKIDEKNTQIQVSLNDHQNLQSIYNLGLNITQPLSLDKTLDENQRFYTNSKQQKTNKQNFEDFNSRADNNENCTLQNFTTKQTFQNSKYISIQQVNQCQFTYINDIHQNQIAEDSYENQNYQSPRTNHSVSILKNNRLTMQSDYITQLESVQQRNKEEDKNKILKGLKPLFLEMKIIKKVFQNLESVINYQIDSQNQNSQDTINSLFHFAKAKKTFQNLKNLTGLSRCYFNLGLIYLLMNEYSLASEYFESSVQQGIEVIGIDYENILNLKIVKSEDSIQNQILILSKRIFSKAYCLKQQALQQIYFINDQHEKENVQNYQQNQQQCQPNQQSNLTKNQFIKQTLQKSLNLFLAVQKIVQNSFECFSHIFKIYLLQEITEVIIHLNQKDQIQKYFNKIEEILQQLNENPKQTDGPFKKISFNKSIQFSYKNLYQRNYLDEVSQIKELQKSRQYFLQGLKEKVNQNYLTAILHFTRSIEEGTHYNPSMRKKAIYQINELFSNLQFKQINVEQKYLKYEQNISIDLVILLQLEFQLQYSTFESCLEKIKKSNFFRSQDRIKIIVYHSDLDVYIPFTIIKDDQIWKMVLDSLKNITKNITQDIKKCYKQLSWQQALFFCLGQHQQYSKEDLMYLKQIYQWNKNQTDDTPIQAYQKEETEYKLEQKSYRKKIILLFSKQQQNDDFNFEIKKTIKIKLSNQEKPIIFHFKEYSDAGYQKQTYSSQHFNYECFLDENILITKLTQQRELQNFNNQNEFLTILNNS
ncbi:tetratricopeptide repeat protein (macronuclear) [Tetrahymena thermophila SB210]|uniref:Tetratricopeptide repeat protein n=1 Tax=Tetrahymena thermophila (strain SB210) TaxID=312017 RepID=Q24HU7_TETTS|nr:tetratricopeptide repeat protein [Tetrahymena thermophila SB210]EAS07340.2 tetratricopeptide repeat protein [Tetrahymena thermophila SB210]|eukprot:XP_001027582.2 tetratricopeptide repeat protein [Tetrahymena thermophila SB210]